MFRLNRYQVNDFTCIGKFFKEFSQLDDIANLALSSIADWI